MRSRVTTVTTTALVTVLALVYAISAWVDAKESDANGICRSIDVRSSVRGLSKLDGCRVIEGDLFIVLIDHVQHSAFDRYTFPMLTEITGFFVLFRVTGLTTLRKLFPNLTVIRGKNLIFNHALVIYEMNHMQEIGLYSLTSIDRGGVYITKNVNLCFASTVDWDLIAKQGQGVNFVKMNRATNECPLCPDDEKNSELAGGNTTLRCPLARNHIHPGNSIVSASPHLCWNRNHCQKVCPLKCGSATCDAKGNCCHEQCHGTCYGPTAEDCAACRNLRWQNACVKECPYDHYKYLNRRCISAHECRQIPKRGFGQYDGLNSTRKNDTQKNDTHVPFNGTCLPECPADYFEQEDEHGNVTCVQCVGKCPKYCRDTIVNSARAAQSLHGCTIVKGSLEIQLREGNKIVDELYENLGEITEIHGYLRVVRSYPIVSLSFLKNLRLITGKLPYAISIQDNPNIMELFEANQTREMKVLSGRPQFHYNPKLCMSKIKELMFAVGWESWSEDEIQSKSNGDKTPCNVRDLPVKITQILQQNALLEWKPFRLEDDRHLLSYVVYHMPTNRTNVSLYESHDACNGDGWIIEDVAKIDSDYIYHPLLNLQPYTNYAVYVKTYTIASESEGAQSDIMYFRTLPSVPSRVLNLKATSNDSDTLIVTWGSPATPNGNLTHYNIFVRMEKKDPRFYESRDHCLDAPSKNRGTNMGDVMSDKSKDAFGQKTDGSSKNGTLSKTNLTKPIISEKEALSMMHFEDALHNIIYVKKASSHVRRRRELAQSNERNYSRNVNRIVPHHVIYWNTNHQTMFEKNQTEAYIRAYNTTHVHMTGLRHYTEYAVSVVACRELIENDRGQPCSEEVLAVGRTKPKRGADDVTDLKIETARRFTNSSSVVRAVKLTWTEPPEPNGVILTYQIEYKRLNVENLRASHICITRKTFMEKGNSHTFDLITPGNYSIRVMAKSLYEEGGNWTNYQYYYLPPMEGGTVGEIAIGTTIGLAIIGAIAFVLAVYVRRNYFPNPSAKLIASVNPDYFSAAYIPDEWEVPRNKIELVKELGQGHFGMVYEGIAHDIGRDFPPEIRCAVKTVNEHATDRERIEFLNEASVMKAFDTAHVVKLMGVVSLGQPTLVVMELMLNGDLKSYLRNHRPEDYVISRDGYSPTLTRIVQMAAEIADGMAYLAAKKFVHRDLAARNCMVSDNLTVKIGDFGMTRDIYETDYYRKGSRGLLPVRWMAPESLKDGVFTSCSDVWSYGVVLWEMVTLASQPYQGLSNDQVLHYVIDGGVMERPDNCPDHLYELMKLCWQHKPSARPSFMEICTILIEETSHEFKQVNFSQVAFYFSADGREIRSQLEQECSDDAEATTPLQPRQGHRSFPRRLKFRRKRDSDDMDSPTARMYSLIRTPSLYERNNHTDAFREPNGIAHETLRDARDANPDMRDVRDQMNAYMRNDVASSTPKIVNDVTFSDRSAFAKTTDEPCDDAAKIVEQTKPFNFLAKLTKMPGLSSIASTKDKVTKAAKENNELNDSKSSKDSKDSSNLSNVSKASLESHESRDSKYPNTYSNLPSVKSDDDSNDEAMRTPRNQTSYHDELLTKSKYYSAFKDKPVRLNELKENVSNVDDT